jgi:hypothetical protein
MFTYRSRYAYLMQKRIQIRGHPDIPMTFIPMTYIPMTKPSMCRYSYKKSVEISKHFNDNRLQQNNTPLLQQPILLYVDIPTTQSSYVSIFQQTKAPMCQYFNKPKLLRVDTSTGQRSSVSIFLQTKTPMCRYSYRDFPLFPQPKLLCCDTLNFFFWFCRNIDT